MLPPRSVHLNPCTATALCDRCATDQDFLRSTKSPLRDADTPFLRVADLFAGCGGMSLGLELAARTAGYRAEIVLVVDCDPDVIEIYKRNITKNAIVADIDSILDGVLGARPTKTEKTLIDDIGAVRILLGGPPCQGHSDLNNHTRRRDPKNSLYLSMTRAAELLLPDVVVIENVAAVQWDQTGVVQTTRGILKAIGYAVDCRVLDLWMVGVPQRRRRFVLLATRVPGIDPAGILESIAVSWGSHPPRTVRWAIEDLLHLNSKSVFDTSSKKSKANSARMAYLFERGRYNLPNDRRPDCHKDGDHSYVSVYGRLRWDLPAQTITTGFGSMGQGRYVHPQRRRTITPHEAARLQTFPDWFDFGENTRRGVLAKAIGNAVPPLLMIELGRLIIGALARATPAEPKRKRA